MCLSFIDLNSRESKYYVCVVVVAFCGSQWVDYCVFARMWLFVSRMTLDLLSVCGNESYFNCTKNQYRFHFILAKVGERRAVSVWTDLALKQLSRDYPLNVFKCLSTYSIKLSHQLFYHRYQLNSRQMLNEHTLIANMCHKPHHQLSFACGKWTLDVLANKPKYFFLPISRYIRDEPRDERYSNYNLSFRRNPIQSVGSSSFEQYSR